MTDWQPIETAPRDGTYIFGWGKWAGEINGIALDGPTMQIIYYSDGRTDCPGFDWNCYGGDAYASWMKPTLWQPLPQPPEAAHD